MSLPVKPAIQCKIGQLIRVFIQVEHHPWLAFESCEEGNSIVRARLAAARVDILDQEVSQGVRFILVELEINASEKRRGRLDCLRC